MIQLVYLSSAHQDTSNKDIEDIITTARKFNAEQDITGCLVFCHGEFLQILEGKKEKVQALFAKIQQDNRHHTVHEIIQEPIKERAFSDWNMAFCELEQNQIKTLSQNLYNEDLISFSKIVEKPTYTTEVFWAYVKILIEEGNN